MHARCALILSLMWVTAPMAVADEEASQAVDRSLEAYTNAYNAKDIDALIRVWAPDADFVDHRGRRFAGRDEIAALFRKALVDGPGYTIKIGVTSRQFLSPDLAMDDGVLELTEPSGEVESGRYVTIWRKQDGQWLIQSVRDMPSDPETKADGQNPLNDLQFLVGDWQLQDAKVPVKLSCDWKAPGKFLRQEYSVGTGDSQFTVTVLIGWDPAARTVRSWFFDSNGGFGDGTWQQRGNAWQIAEQGVLPDGRLSSANSQWQPGDSGVLNWSAKHREVDGRAMPDAELVYVRQE